MTTAFEESLGIIAVAEALQAFRDKFPISDFNKVQLEHEGPYLKYEMVGTDKEYRNTLEINAHTGSVLKERRKPLKEKHKDPIRRERKALNLDQLMPLSEINELAQKQVSAGAAFQWELDREGTRTVWKIEFAAAAGDQITEVKIDAQDGMIVQTKLKS